MKSEVENQVMNAGDTATPTRDRSVTSYPVRRAYVPGVVYPPEVPGVNDFIDIHCHAHQGQQDALSVAKLASQNGMQGILFKSIVGRPKSAAQVMGGSRKHSNINQVALSK